MGQTTVEVRVPSKARNYMSLLRYILSRQVGPEKPKITETWRPTEDPYRPLQVCSNQSLLFLLLH
ncbi:hypothetical protein JMJ77_0015396 [Colletotrichum scovillei]|uniref:Uncharacterized protein n=1 Tax=Colletotrichum scovillei TaxID=1209932 RepID=A0A9P7UAB6_9PEZI|nr:hypothetical protein JMJ77_0015396 [Colletotrichum scovillei]KAG7057045.1 hypothetical protein JMJ78_0000829 [Colletotrichum scovillei]KAG7066950.1 hypothetical protein JMJ76_0000797 [Colletotrichum scovillei]